MLLHALLGLSWAPLAALFAIFVFGGLVKGVTGVGLPLVLVPLAAQFLDVPAAVALVSISMVTT
ncbi:MAG: sulfite exporter TauE/SafE family protein, partial [Alphaproteobacteria bacterium]|nr:sulfite exporter TauE/SafE family protein [Alphaproteobacteria bacterium]